MNQNITVPVAIVVGGLILAAAVYFVLVPRTPGTPTGEGNLAALRPVDSTDHIFGNPAAPIKIIEYTDFDCNFCKTFDTTLREIMANEGTNGDVAWVVRHFPLTEIHPDALKKAAASECAAREGGTDAFFTFSAALFANQPADLTKIGEYAQAAGVPGEAFAACYADAAETVKDRVLADRANARAIGARGTPYSVIVAEGKEPVVMNGAYPYDAVQALIEQMRAK